MIALLVFYTLFLRISRLDLQNLDGLREEAMTEANGKAIQDKATESGEKDDGQSLKLENTVLG